MAISVSQMLTDVGRALHDDAATRWTTADKVRFADAAQRAVCEIRPDAYTIIQDVDLSEGPHHVLPSGAKVLIRPVCNITASGGFGSVVTLVDRKSLDAAVPGWMSATPSATVRHVMYSPATPYVFQTFPPVADQGATIRLEYAINPPVPVQGGSFVVNDRYQNAIFEHMMYSALSRDAEYAESGKADRHAAAFSQYMGV